jgi:hypothetical protein
MAVPLLVFDLTVPAWKRLRVVPRAKRRIKDHVLYAGFLANIQYIALQFNKSRNW